MLAATWRSSLHSPDDPGELSQCLKHDDSIITIIVVIIIVIIICPGWWLWHLLVKYWLLVCAALFLGIAIQEPVIFNIVYMLLFLIFIVVFKVTRCSHYAAAGPHCLMCLVSVYLEQSHIISYSNGNGRLHHHRAWMV